MTEQLQCKVEKNVIYMYNVFAKKYFFIEKLIYIKKAILAGS